MWALDCPRGGIEPHSALMVNHSGTTTSLGDTCSAPQPGPDRCLSCGPAHHQRCKSMHPVKRPFPLLYRYRLIPAPYSPTTPRRAHSPTNGIFGTLLLPLRTLLPSSDRSAGQRNQPSHSTVLARPVCPFVCVSAASFPCRFSDLGLNFLLASAYCTHTLSLDSYCRPTAGKSSSPAGLSTLVHAYVVHRAPASPYTPTPPPHTGFPMSAHLSRLRLFQRHLRSLVWVWVWVWDWLHWHTPPRTRSPSSRHPPFTQYPFPPRSLVCGGQTSPHKPRLVVSHSACPPLSSSPHEHSVVLGTAVINISVQEHEPPQRRSLLPCPSQRLDRQSLKVPRVRPSTALLLR
jgi:hypothetical protein